MSTPTTDLIVAPGEPHSPAPRLQLPPPPRPRVRVPWALAGVAVVAVLALVIATVTRRQTPEPAAEAARTAVAVHGDFFSTLRLSGSTEAVSSYPIIAPRLAGEPGGSLTIVRLQPNGVHIQRGDLLVEFDRQDEIKNYLDHRAKWMDLADQVAKLEKTDAAARAKDETDIRTAEDQLKTAQLEMQKLELLSRIDQETTRLELAQAQASLKELQQTFKRKRAEAAANLRDLELQRDQAQRDMLHSQRNEERMAIRSPINGVVVLHSIWKSGRFALVEEGDQVYPGQGFMEVVDPSEMEVSAKVNQMDAALLKSGEQATVRLDAYPGLALPASLKSMGPIGAQGQFSQTVRDFTAIFSVKEGDPRLMPDLSAAVDVDLGSQKGALMVPNECVARDQGRAYVYVKYGAGFRRQEVKLGPENNLMTVIESGLKAGAVVKRGLDQG